MAPRWTIRALACLVLLVTATCATAAQPLRSARPKEVQVFEPAGQPDRWTYAPNELSVAKGTTVAFVNRGKEFHTVTSDDPGRPFDLSLDRDRTGTITFDTVGVFTYHCGVHPQMKGVVRVCDGACA